MMTMGLHDRVHGAMFADCVCARRDWLFGPRQERDPSRVGVKVLYLSGPVVVLAGGSRRGKLYEGVAL